MADILAGAIFENSVADQALKKELGAYMSGLGKLAVFDAEFILY